MFLFLFYLYIVCFLNFISLMRVGTMFCYIPASLISIQCFCFFFFLIIEQSQTNDELIVASCTERLVESFLCSLGNTGFVSLWAPRMDVLA